MAKPHVVQFEITGRDAEALQAFYGELFGWDLKRTPGGRTAGYRRTSAADTGLPGAVGPTRSGPNAGRDEGWDGPGQLTFYVEVDDIEGAVARAQELGGRLVAPVHDIPGRPLKLAFIADPEGHVVGLSQGLPDALRATGFVS
jgi:predicted enzyme related to lactoylglutathione lyase